MNVLIVGATGKTGSLVVQRALAQGHTASVLVRDPIKFNVPNVRVFTGNATNPSDVHAAMPGQQAVIETIGGKTPYKSTTLETDAINAIISGMLEEHVPRLVSVTMMGIGTSRLQSPFWYKNLLMPTFLRGSTRDKTCKETAIRNSNLDYIIVRPPILKDAAATNNTRILGPAAIGHTITRADLATFLVDQLTTDANLNQSVTVVND
ncbi:MAG: NAD(P)H-binding protein [Acidobacteriaceae bacterium]